MARSRSAKTAPALAIEGVSHRYDGYAALTDVSFSIPLSGFCALLGPNGAGKTTLVSLITRLYARQTGRIAIFGNDLEKRPETALARLGVVFQQRSLDPDLTVMQNLRYQGALHGLPGAEIRARAGEELERIGLDGEAGAPLRKLSGGQARRVEIARALLHRPDLLVLDEPTVGLDPASRRAIHAHALSLRARGVAILWCTHLLDEVEADSQLVILDKGKLLADDIAAKVQAQAGAASIEDAFAALTGQGGGGEQAP